MDAIAEALRRLDRMDVPLNPWERAFVRSLLQQPSYNPTPKQRAVLARIIADALHDEALALEILGQQRLWA